MTIFEQAALKQLSLNEKLSILGTLSKSIMECQTLKRLFGYLKQGLSQLFKCKQAYILVHSEELYEQFKTKEKGNMHTFKVETGKSLLQHIILNT